jgi:hypothetical protein
MPGGPLDEVERWCRDGQRRGGGRSKSGRACLKGLLPGSRGFELPRAHSVTIRLFRWPVRWHGRDHSESFSKVPVLSLAGLP